MARARRVEHGDHLLQRLLQATDADGKRMSDLELRDELVTLFLAGHETRAIAVAVSLWLLAEHPEHQHRVYAEVAGRDPAADDELPFTRPAPKWPRCRGCCTVTRDGGSDPNGSAPSAG